VSDPLGGCAAGARLTVWPARRPAAACSSDPLARLRRAARPKR